MGNQPESGPQRAERGRESSHDSVGKRVPLSRTTSQAECLPLARTEHQLDPTNCQRIELGHSPGG